MIQVIVAEDQAIIREAFVSLVQSQPDMQVLAAVGNGRAAVDNAEKYRPTLVVMDLRMPVVDGIEATRQIVAQGYSRVLVLTTFREQSLVLGAIEAGASGFLLKDAAPQDFLRAIRHVAHGEGFVDPAVANTVFRHVTPHTTTTVAGLTQRESEVLGLICTGLGNATIAQRLGIAESTVKTHVKHLLEKTGARDRVGIVIWAANQHLL